MIGHLHREQFVPGEPARIWEFFASPRNLAALTPARLRFEIIGEAPARMYPGQMIEYRIGLLPGFTTRWLTEITHVREGEYFVDEQRAGPYRLWHHEHHFRTSADGRGVHMTDRITYDPGFGPLGRLADAIWIRPQLRAIFDHRQVQVSRLFPGDRDPPRV